MENKHAGWFLLGIVGLIIIIIFLFNSALKDIVKTSCTIAHGGDATLCPMYKTINEQTYFSLTIAGVLIIVSLFLMFSKPKEKIIFKKIKEKSVNKKIDLSSYRAEEKKVYDFIKENNAMFQADLIEKTGFSKARMTRILDKLEGHGLVERKRRGMTNVVLLKGD